jgi:hypothetical protein
MIAGEYALLTVVKDVPEFNVYFMQTSRIQEVCGNYDLL